MYVCVCKCVFVRLISALIEMNLTEECKLCDKQKSQSLHFSQL